MNLPGDRVLVLNADGRRRSQSARQRKGKEMGILSPSV